MRRRELWAAIAVCCVVVAVAHLAGQGRPASGAAPIKQIGYFKASNPGEYDHFGEGGTLPGHTGQTVSMSADGSTIAVGAPHEASKATGINGDQADNSVFNAGAVYVYVKDGAKWKQQAYVKASNTGSGDNFGSVVTLSDDGNTMAVSAPWESSKATGINGDQKDDSIPHAGAVYIFTRSGGKWTQQAYVKASNTGNPAEDADGDQFGFSLAISGDGNTVAAGAIEEDSNANGINGNQADDSVAGAGAVYVFTRTGGNWSQQAYIKSDAPAMQAGNNLFGFSVALNANGNTLGVGAYDERGGGRTVNAPIDNKCNGCGAIYVYARTGTTWAKQAYLKSSIGEQGDSWGVTVALSDDGNTLITGAADEDCKATGLVTSGCDNDVKDDLSSGAVAVFVRSGTTWSQQAILKASNTGTEDWFGVRVAVSGDGNTFVAAAPNEDSAGQGINNSKPLDDSASEAGAVYVFTRTGTTWSQLAYVKAANNEAFDEFGGSVAMNRDGKLFLVGAKGEDSNATGFNGNEKDNSLAESGAAFLFSR